MPNLDLYRAIEDWAAYINTLSQRREQQKTTLAPPPTATEAGTAADEGGAGGGTRASSSTAAVRAFINKCLEAAEAVQGAAARRQPGD